MLLPCGCVGYGIAHRRHSHPFALHSTCMQTKGEATRVETKHVVAAVIVRDKMVLATQRGYGDWAGWWEFPGGKVEEGSF